MQLRTIIHKYQTGRRKYLNKVQLLCKQWIYTCLKSCICPDKLCAGSPGECWCPPSLIQGNSLSLSISDGSVSECLSLHQAWSLSVLGGVQGATKPRAEITTHPWRLLQEQSSDCCPHALLPNSCLGCFQTAACKHCGQTLEFHYPLLHRHHLARYLRSYCITSSTAMAVKLPWEGRMLHDHLPKHQIAVKKTQLGQPEKHKMMSQGWIN